MRWFGTTQHYRYCCPTSQNQRFLSGNHNQGTILVVQHYTTLASRYALVYNITTVYREDWPLCLVRRLSTAVHDVRREMRHSLWKVIVCKFGEIPKISLPLPSGCTEPSLVITTLRCSTSRSTWSTSPISILLWLAVRHPAIPTCCGHSQVRCKFVRNGVAHVFTNFRRHGIRGCLFVGRRSRLTPATTRI